MKINTKTAHSCAFRVVRYFTLTAAISVSIGCATTETQWAKTTDINDCMVDRCAFVESDHCRNITLNPTTSGDCGELRSCIEHVFDIDGDEAVICGSPRVVRVPSQGHDLLQTRAIAAVDVSYTSVDGTPTHSALLMQHAAPVSIPASTKSKHHAPANEWQAIDQLLEPSWDHGGGCDSDFAARAVPSTGADVFEMVISTQRTCRLPLDKEEFEAGESDEAFTECEHRHYRLAEDGLTLVTWSTSDSCISYRY